MTNDEAGTERNPLVRFFASPLWGKYPAPMRTAGDWFSAAGTLLFVVAVFALPWLTVGISPGIKIFSKSSGLFMSPWAWLMVVVLVAIVAGLWFVQTRGVVLLVAGILCLVFNLVFLIGVWNKTNAVIGDVEALVRSIPVVGEMLGIKAAQVVKSMLDVNVAAGFWLFIPAGLLLIVGGSLRLAGGRGAGEGSLQ